MIYFSAICLQRLSNTTHNLRGDNLTAFEYKSVIIVCAKLANVMTFCIVTTECWDSCLERAVVKCRPTLSECVSLVMICFLCFVFMRLYFEVYMGG